MVRVLTHQKEALSKYLCTKSRFLIINLNFSKYSLIVLRSKIWASNKPLANVIHSLHDFVLSATSRTSVFADLL